MDGTPSRATAIVVQSARLLLIDADDFGTLLAMFPRLQERLRRTRVVNRLLAIPVFGGFSQAQLYDVADLVRVVEYPAGQVVFHQGELADAFYAIDTGQVVERASGTVPGKQTWPKYLTAGSFFGRYSLLNSTTRRATAEAVTDVTLFRLSAGAFHWLRQFQPEFEKALRRHDVLSRLRQIEVFSGLNEEELKHLAGYIGLARFRPGDVLYRQGEIDPTLDILYEGEAIVRARDEAGNERPRGYLKVGDAVGEASLFLREPRDVTVEATTRTNWFYLTREDLNAFLAARPELKDKVIPREEVSARQRLRRLPWLEPDEQVLLIRRRHWFFLTVRLLWPVLLLSVALVLRLLPAVPNAIGNGLLILGILWTIWRLVDWLNDYYVVTTSRVAHREKVLLVRETRDETPLDKIQNVNVVRLLIGNILGFGTLVIDTAAKAGASRVTFTYLEDPIGVQVLVFEQMSRARAGERVEARRAIRDRLEKSMGPGTRPTVPRPAVPFPAPASPPPPSGPGIWDRIWEMTLGRWFWIEKRDDGQVIWRKHWIRLLARIWAPALLVFVLLSLLTGYRIGVEVRAQWMSLLLWVLLLVALGWLWWNWENWGNDRYIVTNDRLIDIEALPLGFLRYRKETLFDRIQNVSYEIPNPIATILNYGTVMIFTAGIEGSLDFLWVRDPRGVQAEIFVRLAAYEERQRREQREERWEDMPAWFAEYDRSYRS
jgi:CRP-like cAMP-binding protein